MRLENNIPVIYDEINPAFTVMTDSGTFENVRFKNCADYETFYKTTSEHIENAKKQKHIKNEKYNPENFVDGFPLAQTFNKFDFFELMNHFIV